jgi:hypothetical protein
MESSECGFGATSLRHSSQLNCQMIRSLPTLTSSTQHDPTARRKSSRVESTSPSSAPFTCSTYWIRVRCQNNFLPSRRGLEWGEGKAAKDRESYRWIMIAARAVGSRCQKQFFRSEHHRKSTCDTHRDTLGAYRISSIHIHRIRILSEAFAFFDETIFRHSTSSAIWSVKNEI